MDPIGGVARFRLRKTQSSDRFLGVFSPSRTEAVSDAGDDFSEYDVFWTGEFAENNRSSPNASLASAAVNRDNHHRRGKGFGRVEDFGILAALPVAESDQNLQPRSVFNHKASVSPSSSSSSASSSRMIPKRKPPLDRQGSGKHYQSAPVNVPVLSDAMRRNRDIREFDDIIDDDGDGDDEADCEMLPPHEIVASKQSPLVACSVLEGVGRTLKGRDLRQVRNAVWRKTGFLD